MNFVDRYFADMKGMIDVYENAQTIFGRAAGADNALGLEKPVKTVNISSVKELGAQAKETGDVDYVWNARELYRVFLRTGGAPHRKGATAFDTPGGESEVMPYPELLGDKEWTLTADFEETADYLRPPLRIFQEIQWLRNGKKRMPVLFTQLHAGGSRRG